jgi:hypothetical protein
MSFIIWHSLALLGAMATAFVAGYITGKTKQNGLDRNNNL